MEQFPPRPMRALPVESETDRMPSNVVSIVAYNVRKRERDEAKQEARKITKWNETIREAKMQRAIDTSKQLHSPKNTARKSIASWTGVRKGNFTPAGESNVSYINTEIISFPDGRRLDSEGQPLDEDTPHGFQPYIVE